MIVGYNDDPGYWICKNSWGTEGGDDGFFYIGYGECNIATQARYFLYNVPVADAGKDFVSYNFVNRMFDGSSSYNNYGDIYRYEWDFGDGTTANGIIVNHSYQKAGTYTVQLTVTGHCLNNMPKTHTDSCTARIMGGTIELVGGFGGLGIHANIRNGFNETFYDIPWSITVNQSGTTVHETNGVINTINPNEIVHVKSRLLFGVGAATVEITVGETTTADCVLLGPLVFPLVLETT
jgi:hypothetical protein